MQSLVGYHPCFAPFAQRRKCIIQKLLRFWANSHTIISTIWFLNSLLIKCHEQESLIQSNSDHNGCHFPAVNDTFFWPSQFLSTAGQQSIVTSFVAWILLANRTFLPNPSWYYQEGVTFGDLTERVCDSRINMCAFQHAAMEDMVFLFCKFSYVCVCVNSWLELSKGKVYLNPRVFYLKK